MLELNEQDKSLCAPSIAIFSMNKHQDRIDQMIAREMHLKKQLNDSVDRFSGKACLKLYEAQRKN